MGFDQHYQQLDAGPYAGAFLTCENGGVAVAVEWTNRTLYQQGAGANGLISAVLLLREGRFKASRLNGGPLTTDHIVLLGEGAPFDATLEAGAVPAVVSIPATEGVAKELIEGRTSCVVAPDLATRFRSLAKGAANGETAAITEMSSTTLMALALSSPSERRRSIDIFRGLFGAHRRPGHTADGCLSGSIRRRLASNSRRSVQGERRYYSRSIQESFSSQQGSSTYRDRPAFGNNCCGPKRSSPPRPILPGLQ